MNSFHFNQHQIRLTNFDRTTNHWKRVKSVQSKAFTYLRHASSTSRKCENNDATAAVVQEPKLMTIVQRFQYFSKAFDNIARDVRIYFLTRDALKTPRNQWTTSTGPPVGVQWKQQRMRRELAWIIPLAGACMLPLIGYIPSFLAFAFPRQMLTRHFWNDYELEYFTTIALATRNSSRKAVCDYWWSQYPDEMQRFFQNNNLHEVDVVNFLHNIEHPPEYWKQVALAAGCFSFFSSHNQQSSKLFVPYWKWQARMHLSQLAADDTLLMKTASLLSFEVDHACKTRGLTMDRQVLQLYLRQVAFRRKYTPENNWGLISLLISGNSNGDPL